MVYITYKSNLKKQPQRLASVSLHNFENVFNITLNDISDL